MLLDLVNAQSFLKQFSTTIRRKGEALVLRGAVEELTAEEPGTDFTAVVQDGAPIDVDVFYLAETGWEGTCGCSKGGDCEHVYAVMRSLLAEHSSAVVRGLSASVPSGTVTAVKAASSLSDGGELARRLMLAKGTNLNREETKFLDKVHTVYKRCRQAGHITHWDFEEMGLRLGGFGWNALHIWPAMPENEFDFWLYVAHAARSRNVTIPPFMAQVTDLKLLEEKMARWQRTQEVERWKQLIGTLQPDLSGSSPGLTREMDLRLIIRPEGAELQWLRFGATEFEPAKPTPLRQLMADYENGRVRFSSEAEWIWQALSARLFYGTNLHFHYAETDTQRILGRLLRLRQLDSRILSTSGLPLARPTEPLRWELNPAKDLDDDYRLRLVKADGAPLSQFLAVLPGHPELYLTAQEVLIGPPWNGHILDPVRETRIPAPALERVQGVALLQALAVPLPQRLQERVTTLPYKLVIACELRPNGPASSTEECSVIATAEAPDGHKLLWTGYNWLDESPAGRKEKPDGAEIVFYDAQSLATVPPLLEGLQLKRSYYGQALVMRVNKKFPELFAAWLKSVPPHITVELRGDLASFAAGTVSGKVRLDVHEAEGEIDWFDLAVVLDVSDTTLTPDEIKLLLNAKGSFVRLKGKGWRRLEFDLTEEENERLAHLGLSARELSAEPQRLHALQLAHESAKKLLPEQQAEQIQRRAGELKARVAPELPAGITAQLRPYQIEGFHFLAYLTTNRFSGILADDMGLGKTLQTLAWLIWLRNSQETPLASLVVCPKSVMDNWQAEALRFAPGLRVKAWPAHELQTFASQLDTADVHVLNYSQLRNLGEALVGVRFLAVILDEGQYIKNPNSQTAQVARALKAQNRLVLSGTPIENRLLDLWSLMAFAMPGVLSSRSHFAKVYDAKGDPLARRRLAARVRPFLLRRTKAQVAQDLPDRIEEDLFCEIEGEQLALYRAELKRAQQLLLKVKTQKELATQQFHFLVSLLRLRQVCCDPRLMKPDSQGSSAKVEALIDLLEPLVEEGQKVLVFSQFVEMLDLLRVSLKARDWPVFYLAGDTENRGDLVRSFQAAEGAGIFLISLKAGGFGLNLTAASYVVLFDPWWNPAVESQAIDRTHRIGQVNKVIAYRLLIKSSIEEKIRALQKQKKALADDVLGEERFAQSLTLDDLRFLFSDCPNT